jgi:hypothetical protein
MDQNEVSSEHSNGDRAVADEAHARPATDTVSDKAPHSSRAAEARDRAANARDRAAEARECRAAESGADDEVMLALRGIRISGAYARQEAALLRGAAEADREEAAAFWRDAARRRDFAASSPAS